MLRAIVAARQAPLSLQLKLNARCDRLAQPYALRAFQLVQRTVDLAVDGRLVAEQLHRLSVISDTIRTLGQLFLPELSEPLQLLPFNFLVHFGAL